jgi:alpha-methylacyl-CoA racemase
MGPLQGLKVLEIAAIGPAPFCGMMLADMGADVLRIDRLGAGSLIPSDPKLDLLNRGKRSVAVDLKSPRGIEAVLRLCERADALTEGFRPGVMERLGLGPDVVLARNPRLIYGRMTGFGQSGPLARAVGHDINYIALSGALHSIGRRGGPPVPPLNLVGDFGGGGMMLAFGLMCGLFEAQRSGRGQVVDAAMVDGSALLMTMIYSFRAMGLWRDERGANLLDTGAHFYDTYETSDGRWIALGPIEPPFYAAFLRLAGLDQETFAAQMDPETWPELREKLAAIFRTKPRDEWCALLEGTDACFSPVLSMEEAPRHPHNAARGTFAEIDGVPQPAPAPRFDRTPPEIGGAPPKPGQDSVAGLTSWGFSEEEARALQVSGAIG